MMEHLPGRPVSASTYRNSGCRCDECCAAATKAQAYTRAKHGKSPSQIAAGKAHGKFFNWAKALNPEVWDEMYQREYAEALQRRP